MTNRGSPLFPVKRPSPPYPADSQSKRRAYLEGDDDEWHLGIDRVEGTADGTVVGDFVRLADRDVLRTTPESDDLVDKTMRPLKKRHWVLQSDVLRESDLLYRVEGHVE